MLRVLVCAAHMGGFLGPKFSRQGSLFRQIFLKHGSVLLILILGYIRLILGYIILVYRLYYIGHKVYRLYCQKLVVFHQKSS